MEVKLLLLKAISLVYYRSHSNNGYNANTDLLLTQVLSHISLPDDVDNVSKERSHLLKLRSLLLWMTRNDPTYVYELSDLMTRIRVAVGDNDRLYELFLQNILHTTKETADDRVTLLVNELTQYIALEDLTQLLRNASRNVAFSREKIEDIARWRAELISKLESLPIEGKRRVSNLARVIDISDSDSVAGIFEAAQAHIDPKMILKFPYVGLNDFTGPQQGLRRGDWSVHLALPGRNKTGVLLDSFVGWSVLNQPYTIKENTKAALLYVTIEDKMEVVFQKFYTILKQIDFGLPVKIVGVPFKEMAEYVKTRFEQNGWKLFVAEFPVGGHNEEYIQLMRDIEDDGYELVGVGCDYVNLIGKQNIAAAVTGDEIKYLHRKIRGYTAPRGIVHMTVHQLGPKAKEMFRVDPTDYIRRLPGQGAMEGCSSLDTEADFLFYIDKAQHGKGAWWQQFQFDKHRRIGTLPDSLKYFAMKFQPYPMMGCRWDVLDEKPAAYDKVGGMKPKPKANWETLAEINAEAIDGVDDHDDLDF